jgi:hypothetical protein
MNLILTLTPSCAEASEGKLVLSPQGRGNEKYIIPDNSVTRHLSKVK